MKLIHTSDIHLASPLTSRLPSSKVASRRRELMSNLVSLCSVAMELCAKAIIIAGDLFDSERITRREMDSTLSIIERAANIAFLYLPGNHERDVILNSGYEIPKNLLIFDKDWTYFKMGELTVAGRSETSADMFDSLILSPDEKNIVVLHGELRERSDAGGIIGINDAKDRNIDYLALGHYHKYSKREIDKRGVAVYSGAPEGRGFDETGEMGFSLIETEPRLTSSFRPFGKRRLIIRDVDISGLLRSFEVEERIRTAISDIDTKNLVRVNMTGARELELSMDRKLIEQSFSDSFYYFELKDSSRLITRAEDYIHDKSLRGEFIRLCLSDTSLSDEEKEKIIHCGLSALAGEAFDE